MVRSASAGTRLVAGLVLLLVAYVFIVLTSLSTVVVNAQEDAPAPADSSTSFCDESLPNVPSFCDERTDRVNASTGTSAIDDSTSPLLGKNSILYRILQVLTMITGALSVIMIIIGGFRYVTSGGGDGVKGAKDTILYAVIGLLVAIFAQTIITFVLSQL